MARPPFPFPCNTEYVHISISQVVETVVTLEEERKAGEKDKAKEKAGKNLLEPDMW